MDSGDAAGRPRSRSLKVISTSVLVLPGARGHVGAPGSRAVPGSRPTHAVHAPSSPRSALILPSCVDVRRTPDRSRRPSGARSIDLSTPAFVRGLGEADRAIVRRSGSGAARARLGCVAGRGATSERRRSAPRVAMRRRLSQIRRPWTVRRATGAWPIARATFLSGRVEPPCAAPMSGSRRRRGASRHASITAVPRPAEFRRMGGLGERHRDCRRARREDAPVRRRRSFSPSRRRWALARRRNASDDQFRRTVDAARASWFESGGACSGGDMPAGQSP